MTNVIEVPFNEALRDAIWPSFKVDILDKHGHAGSEGARGESNALKLLIDNFNYKAILDHAKDVWGQLFGIDFTCFNSRDDHITVDAKSGRSSLYYDFDNSYWYITIKPEFFNEEKTNSHIMQVGPKGDKFAIYKKSDMQEFLLKGPRLIDDKYGKRLMLKDFPDFIQHNIKRY